MNRQGDRVGRVVDIEGLPIADLGFDRTVSHIVEWALDGSGGVVCTPNVDYVVRAARDPEFRKALLTARLRVPDGMGIVYGSRIQGSHFLSGTVTGRLLPTAVARQAARHGIKLAFFGGGPGIAEAAAEAVQAEAGATIDPAFGPPMAFVVGSLQDAAAVNALRQSDARIIFVALGAPKQEIWMATHESALPGRVLVGVGQAFDVLSGRRRAAPRWATRVGLEWAFRIFQEPRRLANRYLVEDPRFFMWMVRRRLRPLIHLVSR